MNITHEQIKKGDIVTNTTEIRRYDIVCFERTGESQVICRTLSSAEAATYQGNKYQIDRGNEPGSLQYIKVE